MNLQENIQRIKQMMGLISEGLDDTSWSNDDGDNVTLRELLKFTEELPIENVSLSKLKPMLLSWNNNKEEVKKIDKAELKYPILLFVNDKGKIITIIDGHHRAQKAVKKGLKTIKAKKIQINSLPKKIRKVFSHIK